MPRATYAVPSFAERSEMEGIITACGGRVISFDRPNIICEFDSIEGVEALTANLDYPPTSVIQE